MTDYNGLDTAKNINDQLAKKGQVKIRGQHIIDELVAQGRLGRKSGKGFYDYTSGEKK